MEIRQEVEGGSVWKEDVSNSFFFENCSVSLASLNLIIMLMFED